MRARSVQKELASAVGRWYVALCLATLIRRQIIELREIGT